MKSGYKRYLVSEAPLVLRSLADMPRLPVSLGTTLANKTGTWRYIRPLYENKTPPCNHACPAGSDIVHVLAALQAGDAQAAWRLLATENPLPGVCGRVCPHPCERDCNRAGLGGAIAIRAIERYLADEAAAHGWHIDPARQALGRPVAIIGAGPAGLSCAYHLARLGYAPTVYEATNSVGGLLSHGIPAYRLPRAVLDRETAALESVGVRVALNRRLGDNLSLEELDNVGAIFLAIGQGLSRPLVIKGEGAAGVLPGLELLRRLASGKRVDLGRRVVVVGGGNTALDAARSAVRLGAEVTIVYRRSEQHMPAIAEEVEEAREEGVSFRFLAAPSAVLTNGERVKALRCVRTQLGEPDASGRQRPIPISDSEFDLPADTVVVAAGQQPDLDALAGYTLRIENERVVTDSVCATAIPGLFAGGDVTTGEGTVAQAIGSGKRAALTIDHYLQRGELPNAPTLPGPPRARPLPAAPVIVGPTHINRDYFDVAVRPALPQREPSTRRMGFSEVNASLGAEAAMHEAGRCLSCGTCNACDTCLILCPDVSIARDESGTYAVDYDYCKGCGICVEECPRSAMVMVEEDQ